MNLPGSSPAISACFPAQVNGAAGLKLRKLQSGQAGSCLEGGASVGVTWSLAPPTHLHPQARGGPRWRRVGCSQDGGGTGQPLGHLPSVTLSSASGSSDSPPLPPHSCPGQRAETESIQQPVCSDGSTVSLARTCPYLPSRGILLNSIPGTFPSFPTPRTPPP